MSESNRRLTATLAVLSVYVGVVVIVAAYIG